MYLIQSKVDGKAPRNADKDVLWAAGQIGFVEDEVILHYQNNAAAWTVLAGPDFQDVLLTLINISNNPGAGDVVAADGLAIADTGVGVVQKTVFTFDAMELTVTDALAYASKQLYDFPEGRILVLGATGSLQFAVGSERAGTINDDASLTWSLGTAAASNIVLSGTMINLLPKATKVLAADNDELNTASTNALAASAHIDGTGTALEAHLNVGFETNTQIDADGVLLVTGSITLTWLNLGDY